MRDRRSRTGCPTMLLARARVVLLVGGLGGARRRLDRRRPSPSLLRPSVGAPSSVGRRPCPCAVFGVVEVVLPCSCERADLVDLLDDVGVVALDRPSGSSEADAGVDHQQDGDVEQHRHARAAAVRRACMPSGSTIVGSGRLRRFVGCAAVLPLPFAAPFAGCFGGGGASSLRQPVELRLGARLARPASSSSTQLDVAVGRRGELRVVALALERVGQHVPRRCARARPRRGSPAAASRRRPSLARGLEVGDPSRYAARISSRDAPGSTPSSS